MEQDGSGPGAEPGGSRRVPTRTAPRRSRAAPSRPPGGAAPARRQRRLRARCASSAAPGAPAASTGTDRVPRAPAGPRLPLGRRAGGAVSALGRGRCPAGEDDGDVLEQKLGGTSSKLEQWRQSPPVFWSRTPAAYVQSSPKSLLGALDFEFPRVPQEGVDRRALSLEGGWERRCPQEPGLVCCHCPSSPCKRGHSAVPELHTPGGGQIPLSRSIPGAGWEAGVPFSPAPPSGLCAGGQPPHLGCTPTHTP
ncbi:transcription initiation factor TFIID subunit 4-like [Cuculus canorus]|uniref:transcription initiation factor TFIID subunit 4-like n=1 Tax=Cuculus canorus TaxID=55661 RepID=UPI0023AA8C93|nr:transcription initiation factor TFIID subunit 4-like [Cuculus canorus]